MRGSPSDASASSAAKPAGDELEPCAFASESMTPTLHASESLTLTLPDVLSQLIGESLQADAQQLLQDILVQNLDMMAIARTVELRTTMKNAHAEDEHDDEDDARTTSSRMHSEFIGGEHDLDEEVGIGD